MEGLGSRTGGSTSQVQIFIKTFGICVSVKNYGGPSSRTGGSTSIAPRPRYRCLLKPSVFESLGRTAVSPGSHRDGWWQVAGTGVC